MLNPTRLSRPMCYQTWPGPAWPDIGHGHQILSMSLEKLRGTRLITPPHPRQTPELTRPDRILPSGPLGTCRVDQNKKTSPFQGSNAGSTGSSGSETPHTVVRRCESRAGPLHPCNSCSPAACCLPSSCSSYHPVLFSDRRQVCLTPDCTRFGLHIAGHPQPPPRGPSSLVWPFWNLSGIVE